MCDPKRIQDDLRSNHFGLLLLLLGILVEKSTIKRNWRDSVWFIENRYRSKRLVVQFQAAEIKVTKHLINKCVLTRIKANKNHVEFNLLTPDTKERHHWNENYSLKCKIISTIYSAFWMKFTIFWQTRHITIRARFFFWRTDAFYLVPKTKIRETHEYFWLFNRIVYR